MSKTPRTDEGGLILIDELQMLIDSKPGVFGVHYVDEVKRIAQQALWAIQQGNIALEELRGTRS